MARMTRTQVTLERDEYEFLKAEAGERGCSLSSVVRGLVRTEMVRASSTVPHVWEIAGLFADGEFSGKDHDAILYGEPERVPPAPEL